MTTLLIAQLFLAGAGDIGRCGEHARDTARILAQLPPAQTTVITLGDNAYGAGTDQQFRNCYDPAWGPFKAWTRPSLGGHDWMTEHGGPYFRYFGARAPGPYYSYDVGTWHVVVLNSNTPGDLGQRAWLEADLRDHPNVCTAAYYHNPRWSSGGHGSQASSNLFWAILTTARVDVVLGGHDHVYERFGPQDRYGTADPEGTQQFVVGTGGAETDHFRETAAANSEVRIAGVHGVIVLTLDEGSYRWSFVDITGAVRDTGSRACH